MVGYLEIIDGKWMVRSSEMSAHPLHPDDTMVMEFKGEDEIGKRVDFDYQEIHPIKYAKIRK
jgi:hypothetical protein